MVARKGDSMLIDDVKSAAVEALYSKFATSAQGLSTKEATNRLEKYGYNEIPEKKRNPLKKLLGYFYGPIAWMIEAAAIISLLIGHWHEFWIIFSLLLLNAGIAFWHERGAEIAIQSLKSRLAIRARVLRDRKWTEVPSRELVPGDIISIRLGDIVPADVKLVEGEYLLTDESALTGESLPVEKKASDVAYSSSTVQKGEMKALVFATGANTYFGKTASMIEEAKTQTHFQKAVTRIGNYLIMLAIALVAIVFLVALFRQESLVTTLQFALVLIVASIPAALPAVLSVTLAVGASILAKKRAIVRKLAAVEELSGMDILCSDKTGTLTTSQLSVAEVVPLEGFSVEDVLLFAALTASKEKFKDPIDAAVLSKCESIGVVINDTSYQVTNFVPFDPVVKRAEATVTSSSSSSSTSSEREFKVSKGAAQVILSLVSNNREIAGRVEQLVSRAAKKGSRSLGVARADTKGNWQFAGVISLSDPPREDSKETIDSAKAMGLNVKMVTGDHVAIAKEIAMELNLGSNIVQASALGSFEDHGVQEELVENADGFAQVFPEHKYNIVKLLQSKGHIVGMTGDGVNDAPALKKADVGIAVSGATDAAKSSADIVLTEAGISVIVDAIRESRKIFQRMKNYAIYRIAETIRILFFLTASIIIFNFYPITPLMIVLLALLNDIPIMSIAKDNVRHSEGPERWNMRRVLGMATAIGIIGVISSFIVLYLGNEVFGLSPDILQSFIYLKLSVSGHMVIFAARTKGYFWSVRPSKYLLAAVLGTQTIATIIAAQGLLIPSIGWSLAAFIWAYGLVAFLITDFLKVRIYRLLDSNVLRFNR